MARLNGSIGNKNKPNGNTGIPPRPATLSDRAAKEWDRLVAELERSGMQITPAHRSVLSTAAKLAADISRDWDIIESEGAYQHNIKTQTSQAHPAVRRMDGLRRDLLKALAMLGIRAPNAIETPDGEKGLDAILSGK